MRYLNYWRGLSWQQPDARSTYAGRNAVCFDNLSCSGTRVQQQPNTQAARQDFLQGLGGKESQYMLQRNSLQAKEKGIR